MWDELQDRQELDNETHLENGTEVVGGEWIHGPKPQGKSRMTGTHVCICSHEHV